MNHNQDGVDYEDPRSILEAKERDGSRDSGGISGFEFSAALGRILTFMIDGGSLALIGLRAKIVMKKVRPDLIRGESFHKIAEEAGFGRSHAHKLSKEFENIFGIRGIHDKSDRARKSCSRAWHKTNIPQGGAA